MGQVIQPTKIERHVITEKGEMVVTINLNLTITLDSDGKVSSIRTSDPPSKMERPEIVIPDFGENSEIIEFGK